MKYLHLKALLVAAALLALPAPALLSAAENLGEHQVFLNVDDMKWQNAPPGLPSGAKVTVLFGDPHSPGPFVLRMSTPAGYKIPPHWHSRSESLTILSGALYLGSGDTLDYSQAHALKPGGYHYLPGKTHHYGFTDTPTVIQVNGEGPFDIHYVNPGDDPRSHGR